jgi:cell division protein ZipA
MSALQWSLLLLGGAIVVLLLWSSRRERKALERMNAPAPAPARRDWETAAPEAAPRAAEARPGQFDELGVGKPRSARAAAPRVAPEAAPAPAARVADKVVGLYIAEHEGTNILGPKIHAALQERGLRFGDKRIYHRLEDGHSAFSVASLVKPGALDPAEAEGFATPGLSVFMVLPGPARPLAAFQDMLDTARALARALNAELYDSEQRAPLTAERERALRTEVEDWARRHAGATRPRA